MAPPPPPPPNIWVSFTSLSPVRDPNDNFVLQVTNKGRPRDSSQTMLHPSTEGVFSNPVPCALHRSETITFALHVIHLRHLPVTSHFSLDPDTLTPSTEKQTVTTDDEEYEIFFDVSQEEPNYPKEGLVLSLDIDNDSDPLLSSNNSLSLSPSPRTTANAVTNVDSPSSSSASPPPPPPHNVCMKDMKAAIVTSSTTTVLADVSFSSVSEDDDFLVDDVDDGVDVMHSSALRSKKRVSFNSRVKRIPTTEILQKEAHGAALDRVALWHAITDLTSQVHTLRAELRHQQALHQRDHLPIEEELCTPVMSPVKIKTRSHITSEDNDNDHTSNNKVDTTTISPTLSSQYSKRRRRRAVIIDGDMVGKSTAKLTTAVNGDDRQDANFDVRACVEAMRYFKNRGVHNVVVMVSSTIHSSLTSMQQKAYAQLLETERALCICPISTNGKNRLNFLISYALDHDADIVSNAWTVDLKTKTKLDLKLDKAIEAVIVPFMFVGREFVPDRTRLTVFGSPGVNKLGQEEGQGPNCQDDDHGDVVDEVLAVGILRRCGTI